ncbi:P-loop containing nucleoside triphosphate hydrolase protein [Gigaspora margarita]|nr:P-loop containing nucleoside triphosphate hydrolase protein [Gigaspora margarita]
MTITKEPKKLASPVKNDNTTQTTKRKNMLDYWGKPSTEVASPILSKETSKETTISRSKETSDIRPTKQIKTRHTKVNIPLAARVRPKNLDTFVGQKDLIGENGMLRNLILHDKIPSMIFWGPSGTGKTTLARIITKMTQSICKEFSGITHASADIKKAFDEAKNEQKLTGRRTIIFLDEIHRFNKPQQDLFLPYVESGDVTLIGATTENPSFKINSALLSRCKVFTLKKLSPDEIHYILQRAIQDIFQQRKESVESEEAIVQSTSQSSKEHNEVDDDVLRLLAVMSDGDARVALNSLEIALNASCQERRRINKEDIKIVFQKSHLLYDKDGEEHYNIISALHKSMRGSDANASLYWLGRMLIAGEDPLYIARRLIVFASEDVGLADNNALPLATATYQACQFIGMPECEINLAHCVTYLAETQKSVRTYKAYGLVKQTVQSEYTYPVPLHLRNAPTKLMKDFGYGFDYKYNPDYEGPVNQEYLPKELKCKVFLDVYGPTKRDELIEKVKQIE